MARYIVLRRMLKERDQPLRKKRVFRDRSQELDTLNDQELISRYRFPSQVISDWSILSNRILSLNIEIACHLCSYTGKFFVLIGSSLVFKNDGTIHRQLGV